MPVPPQYIFQIAAPYTRTPADDAEILRDQAASTKWGKGYWGFRFNIRTYLKLAQRGRCAFCRIRISVGTSWSNLEHMVPKDAYPSFEFLPENLVYCCTKCNMSKIVQNTISAPNPNPALQIYPSNSGGFTIINPYHDPYESHIDFLDDVLIVALNSSPKGLETIKLYKLFRPELAEDRASELQLNQQNVYKQLLMRLTTSHLDPEVVRQINEIIAQMPNWTL